MKQMFRIGWTLSLLGAVGLCLPATTSAATHTKMGPTDVKLVKGGILVGQVIDAQGRATASTPVTVQHQNRLVASPITDKNGYFALKGIQSGVYRIASQKGVADYRVWAEGTAPPKAVSGALLVEGSEVIRGQGDCPPPPYVECPPPPQYMALQNVLANPWVVTGIVATAIAVPVAIHNSQGHNNPVSP